MFRNVLLVPSFFMAFMKDVEIYESLSVFFEMIV